MTSLCKKGLVLALVLAAVAITTQVARAEDSRYGVFAIENKTGRSINYAYKWGQNGEWKNITVEAGNTTLVWWQYATPGVVDAPTPHLYVDRDLSDAEDFVEVTLASYSGPSDDLKYAKKYYLKASTDGKTLEMYPEN